MRSGFACKCIDLRQVDIKHEVPCRGYSYQPPSKPRIGVLPLSKDHALSFLGHKPGSKRE